MNIYIGESIKYRSEYDCFLAIYEILKESHNWFYIFANFHASDRQIDLAVFTENTTLIIEVKNYVSSVYGQINGQWSVHGAYGEKTIRNGYNQALDAKNALRDNIQKISQVEGYPNAVVTIVPHIPNGSSLTKGDFKVAVGGIDVLKKQLTQPSGAVLTPLLCEALANSLNLYPVSSIDSVFAEDTLHAEKSYYTYIKAFQDFYTPYIRKFIHGHYTYESNNIDFFHINSMISRGETSLVIMGPSGCGKTFLSLSCATLCCDSDCIPIFVRAKEFNNQFQKLLNKETFLLNNCTVIDLINTGKILGKRLILFMDGYNECPDYLKLGLTRSLKAFSLRYDVMIVISSQTELTRSDLLQTKTLFVERPSNEFKIAVSGIKETKDYDTKNLHGLLQIVDTCLEASLIGKISKFLPVGASRFVLFNTYVRNLLKSNAVDGIRALSYFADTLIRRACFSMSIREIDRVCDSNNLDAKTRQQILLSGLLQARSDRVSFSHELFFAAFAAEAMIRIANDDYSTFITALSSPRLSFSKVLILGAIENDRLLRKILNDCKDQDLVAACANGECGVVAQSIINCKIDEMLKSMVLEAQQIKFKISEKSWNEIIIDKFSLNSDLENFSYYLIPISKGLMNGLYFDYVMAACLNTDKAMKVSAMELKSEANKKNISLKHNLFSTLYVMHKDTAVSKIVSFIGSYNYFSKNEKCLEFYSRLKKAWLDAKTSGEIYFLIEITRIASAEEAAIPFIVELVKNISSFPYHLQFTLIRFCQYFSESALPYRIQIINALTAVVNKLGVIIDSLILDTLKVFGALKKDEDDYELIINNEIENTLTLDDSESNQLAWQLFARQFDHPFDYLYSEKIQNLDESQKKLLLNKACLGASSSDNFFLGILLRQLSEFNDLKIAPTIAKWTVLPDKKSIIPQESIKTFIIAHEAIGYLKYPLPQNRGKPKTAEDFTLLACGELYYWYNRKDIEKPQFSHHTLNARTTILEYSKTASASALMITTLDGQLTKSLVNKYPDMVLSVCREVLRSQNEQLYYFPYMFKINPNGIIEFAIHVLGKIGNINDLLSLRELCDHESYGYAALNAIRCIEERIDF